MNALGAARNPRLAEKEDTIIDTIIGSTRVTRRSGRWLLSAVQKAPDDAGAFHLRKIGGNQ